MVELCLAAGITPYLTLYHWELPQAVEEAGGWLRRETAEAFARFAGRMAAHFRGRVHTYFTLNEPQCTVSLGYALGVHAPGKKLPPEQQFLAWKHQLLAHGLAQRAILREDPTARVGIASTGRVCYPETEDPETIAAAEEAMFAVSEDDWLFTHQMLLDPICFGRFPPCSEDRLGALMATVTPEEMALIHTPPHILGLNIYNGNAIRVEQGRGVYAPRYPGFPRTALKWPITPRSWTGAPDSSPGATACRDISRKTA